MKTPAYYYHQIRIWLILHKYKVTAGILLAVIGVVISSFGWLCPRPAELSKQVQEKIDQIPKLEQRTAEIAESVKKLEIALGQKPYLDGLAQSPPPVFDPFAKGLDLMAQSKWDEAIAQFKESMKEAKGSEIVALYNLIGLCYYTPGKLDSALSSYDNSFKLARQFEDSEGEAAALGNIGLIYLDKGDLDAALKYLQETLKIDREIGYKQGEASALGNIGLIYSDKGDLDAALKYHQEALKIAQEIGHRQNEANQLGNIGLIYSAKGDLDAALNYLEEARAILIKHNLAYGRDIIENAIAKIKAKEAK